LLASQALTFQLRLWTLFIILAHHIMVVVVVVVVTAAEKRQMILTLFAQNCYLKPCPQSTLSQKTATVTVFGDKNRQL